MVFKITEIYSYMHLYVVYSDIFIYVNANICLF